MERPLSACVPQVCDHSFRVMTVVACGVSTCLSTEVVSSAVIIRAPVTHRPANPIAIRAIPIPLSICLSLVPRVRTMGAPLFFERVCN